MTAMSRVNLPDTFSIVSTVALNQTLQVTQKPRFYGVKTSRSVVIYCVASGLNLPAQVQWYKASEYNVMSTERIPVWDGERVNIWVKTPTRNASIRLWHLGTEDSGVYYCKINGTWGPGTEVQVVSKCPGQDVWLL